jgi:hypothetical protein
MGDFEGSDSDRTLKVNFGQRDENGAGLDEKGGREGEGVCKEGEKN